MSRALTQFRSLSLAEVGTKCLVIKTLIEAADWPDEDKEFATGLAEHFAALGFGAIEYVEKIQASLDKLPQSHQGKEFLQAELNEYALVAPNIRQKIRDRLRPAMVQDAPEPEVKKQLKSVSVGGREFAFPEGMDFDE